MNTLLSLGIAMAAGLLFTRIVKLVKLPNVTGYLLAGLLIGPSVLGLVSREAVESFDILVTLALGFIAFSIGGEFKLDTLKKLGKKVTVITLVQALGAVVAVFAVLLVAGALGAFGENYLPLVFTLSAIATATAPAATLLVVRQYKAHGPLTETLLPVVAGDDAIGLIIFSIFMAIAQTLAVGTEPTVMSMLLEPLAEIGLSLLIGFGLGLLVALGTRLFKSRANRLCLCVTATVIGVGLSELLELSSLLLCMMIGAVLANLGRDVEKVLDGTDRWTPLFLCCFLSSRAQISTFRFSLRSGFSARFISWRGRSENISGRWRAPQWPKRNRVYGNILALLFCLKRGWPSEWRRLPSLSFRRHMVRRFRRWSSVRPWFMKLWDPF